VAIINILSSKVESNYLLIVASASIVTNEEYRLLVKLTHQEERESMN